MSEQVFTVKINDKDKKVKICKPSSKVESDANIYSSKVFAKLIKQRDENGDPAFLVRSNLDSYLKDMGLFTAEDIKDLSKLSKDISTIEKQLQEGGIKKRDGRQLAIKLKNARYELLVLLNKRAEYDRHTVESYADNAKSAYIVSKCLLFEDGDPIFSSVEDYESDENLREALEEPILKLRVMTSLYDPHFEDKLIENKFLKKFGYCDDDYNLVDDEGRLVDEDGQLINKNGQLVDEDGNLVDADGNPVGKDVGEFLDDDDEPEAEAVADTSDETEE